MADLGEGHAIDAPDPTRSGSFRTAYLFVTPWRHEFAGYEAGHVPSHRLFFAPELSTLGYCVETFEQDLRRASRTGVFRWRMKQAWWAARGDFSVIIATHEAAAYPTLLLRRLFGSRRTPVVALTVAAVKATEGRGAIPILKRWLLNAADIVTVYSRDQLSALRERLPGPALHFLPLGVDTEYFEPPLQRTHALDILSVGTNEGKDYPTLIQALPEGRQLTIVTQMQRIDVLRRGGHMERMWHSIPMSPFRSSASCTPSAL